MNKRIGKREKVIIVIIIIIVLSILVGVTIFLVANKQGTFNKISYLPGIRYKDTNGQTQVLSKDTPIGTKIGTTDNIDGQSLDWYLFDIDETEGKAYLISTPAYWIPEEGEEVNGAWAPKLVSDYNIKTGAMNQAIQKKSSATRGSYLYSYSSSSVTYTPSDKTLSYFRSANSKWSVQRGNIAFTSLYENEQAACYLSDDDVFTRIKDQVNSSDGNLKGKIKKLVGGASAEQWEKSYNKQDIVKNDPTKQITCEYSSTNKPGYIYKINKKQSIVSNSDYNTGINTVYGNDIYGATKKNGNMLNNQFYSWWWLASPSSVYNTSMCTVNGYHSLLNYDYTYSYYGRISLLASVAL